MCLISLNIFPPDSLMLLQMIGFHILMPAYAPLCIYTFFLSICQLVGTWIVSVFDCCECCCSEHRCQMIFQPVSFEYVPSGSAGAYVSSVFNFEKTSFCSS